MKSNKNTDRCTVELLFDKNWGSLDISGNYVIFKNDTPIYCGESSRLIARINEHKNNFIKDQKEIQEDGETLYKVELYNLGAEKQERLLWEQNFHNLHNTLLSNSGDYKDFEFKQKYDYIVEHRDHGKIKVERPLSTFCERYGLRLKGFSKILYEGKPSYKGWSLVSKVKI